jgi:hypothetical protein
MLSCPMKSLHLDTQLAMHKDCIFKLPQAGLKCNTNTPQISQLEACETALLEDGEPADYYHSMGCN